MNRIFPHNRPRAIADRKRKPHLSLKDGLWCYTMPAPSRAPARPREDLQAEVYEWCVARLGHVPWLPMTTQEITKGYPRDNQRLPKG